MHRVLQVGLGRIGMPMFLDYARRLPGIMGVDPAVEVVGRRWDGNPVDLAVIVVDTPARCDGGYDYGALLDALGAYAPVAEFLLVRSTVGLDFLAEPAYLDLAASVGFAPEFYGTTEHSRRGVIEVPSIFTDNVPDWFVDQVAIGTDVLRGTPSEVIVAKLAENAYLATKVTFFHELFELCAAYGIDFEQVRSIVTADPRIVDYHSHCDGRVGWSSHCFDKDVPVYADLAGDGLVAAMLRVNRSMLERGR